MNQRLTFDVFGRLMAVRREASHWRLYDISTPGKRVPVQDVQLPDDLQEGEIAGFLDDIYHEWATPERVSVERLE